MDLQHMMFGHDLLRTVLPSLLLSLFRMINANSEASIINCHLLFERCCRDLSELSLTLMINNKMYIL